jgi:hypothetical protein
MFPFRKRQQNELDDTDISAKDLEVEKKLAEINKSTAQASKQAIINTRKVTQAIVREDIALNFYYATHSEGRK